MTTYLLILAIAFLCFSIAVVFIIVQKQRKFEKKILENRKKKTSSEWAKPHEKIEERISAEQLKRITSEFAKKSSSIN